MLERPQHLFVVISTGQNVANLPPILEISREGDRVLWLETKEASSERWTQPAMDVLKQFDLVNLPPVQLPSRIDANAWREIVRPYGELCHRDNLQPVLVLNGGHKLITLTLYEVWRPYQPVLVYGFDRPAGISVSTCGDAHSFSPRPYQTHALDLPHILLTNGYTIHSNLIYGCIYRAYSAGQSPKILEQQGDESLTQRWTPLLSLIPTDHVEQIFRNCSPQQLDGWLRSLKPFLTLRREPTEQMFESLYHATVNIVRGHPPLKDLEIASYKDLYPGLVSEEKLYHWKQGLLAIVRAPRKKPTPGKKPALSADQRLQVLEHVCSLIHVAENLGARFERLVAQRVVDLVCKEPSYGAIVQSVWMGVKVSPISDPGTVVAELDVLLVLKNAILIHIECKAGIWDKKDLDARIANLKRIGSSIARFCVCAPMFTQRIADIPVNLVRMHHTRIQLEGQREVYYLPYTRAGQPRHYTVPDETGELRQYEVSTFEEAFDRLLRSYMFTQEHS
jgi:hypothetical protein